MMLLNTILLLVALALAATCSWQAWRNQHRLRQLAAGLGRVNNRVRKRQSDLLEFRNKKRLLEQTVHSGTTAVEAVHRVISATTFELIDRFSGSDSFRQSARQARQTHDQTRQTLYRSVRTTNRTLHALTDMLMERKSRRNRDRD